MNRSPILDANDEITSKTTVA